MTLQNYRFRADAGASSRGWQHQRLRAVILALLGVVSACEDPHFCFPPGVLVRLDDGSVRPIEAIRVRDRVLALDERQAPVSAIVLRTFKRRFSGSLVVVNDHLRVTPEHPVFASGEWIPASELEIGDELIQLEGHDRRTPKVVVSLGRTDYEGAVYNLEVAPFHNYFANGIFVHNKSDAGTRPLDSGFGDNELSDAAGAEAGSGLTQDVGAGELARDD